MNSAKLDGPNRTLAQVEHKWWDLKAAAKQAVADWKKECNKTGGGSNRVQQPSELHHGIIQIIGEQSVAGIEGVSGMKVARPTTSGNKYF